MDIKKGMEKVLEFVKKYRFVALILVIGIILMLLPSQSRKEEAVAPENGVSSQQPSVNITQELSAILSQIQGVGQVQVMLTVSTGQQTVYQVDEDITTNENGSTVRKETVIITGTDRQEQALVSHVTSPVYLGAIIVCQGADQPSVKLAVMDAVCKITGLSSDKISVVKMK